MLQGSSIHPLILGAALLLCGSGVAAAQGLPGGASSLNETHGDWRVTCAAPEQAVRCAISQAQMNAETRQRVLTVEVWNTAGGAAEGVLVLPFGLRLADGVTLSIDGAPGLPALPFSTCVPAGCLVPLALAADSLAGLRAGAALGLQATANDTGQQVALSVSLSGFGAALARAADLGGG